MADEPRFIGPVERLLYLSTLPGLSSSSPAELASIGQHVRERSFARGEHLLQEGAPAESVFFLVEGSVTILRQGQVLQRVEPPFGVGFLPVLSEDPEGVTARADSKVLALELAADDLIDAMEDSFSLLESGVRQLSRQLAEAQAQLESRGLLERDEPLETEYPEAPLDLVQRLTLFRRRGPYMHASLDSMAELVRRAAEVRYEPGVTLWTEGDAAAWGVQIIHGVVTCSGKQPPRAFRMGPDSVLGVVEANAQLPRSYTAVTETRVVALRMESETGFDIIEDDAELGLALLRFLATLINRLYVRLAADGAGDGAMATLPTREAI